MAKKPQLKADVDQTVKDKLRAISLASPDGEIDESAQIRKAVAEYIDKRFERVEVQQIYASMRGQPLQLVPKESKAEGNS